MNKSQKSKRLGDDGLETIVRHWPYFPDHARRTLIDLAERYCPTPGKYAFPTPAGSDWTDVTILLLTGNEAQITVGDTTRIYTFEQMGLQTERRPNRTKNEGKMLRVYAENPEAGSYFRLPFRENLKVHISEFRKWLQGFFGIAGDPLKPFKTAQWMPRFKIRAKYL